MKIAIFDIQRGSFVDGDGIRTAVFFKGCNLRCTWCHNPEGLSSEKQMMYYRERCTGCGKCTKECPNKGKDCTLCGKCADFCPSGARELCGKEYDVDELFDIILRDKPYFDASNGGVTATGGECMLQKDALSELLRLCKENGINTAVDTAGNVPFEFFEKVIPYTDTFLYDIKCISDDKHKRGTGVSNALILENLERLSERGCDIVIRIPVIPGFNDDAYEVEKIKEHLKKIRCRNIEYLPYHKMGEHKYKALGLEFKNF
jgi:pyruvate formate lyase activating enzyme